MLISLDSIGKKFNQNWIFNNLSGQYESGKSVAVVGPNGSGKSTLIQVIAGLMPASKGTISYSNENGTVPDDEIYRRLILVTPTLELIEEFTLSEFLKFHFSMREPDPDQSLETLLKEAKIARQKNRYLKHFSSGMKQRLKLILAFATSAEMLLLDEPTSNLDEQGIDWYQEKINKLAKKKLLFIASNQRYEHDFCDIELNLLDFK